MNSTQLASIAYPVFRVGEKVPETVEGVTYFFFHYEAEEEEDADKIVFKVVDDKNVEGGTLAHRRLKLMGEGVRLHKLGHAIFFLGDLVKLSKTTTWFIDSSGKLFKYIKSTRAKLRFHRVESVIPIKSGGCIIVVQGIPSRFKSLYYPENAEDRAYVGILHFGMSLVMYGFYDKEYDETWRMI